MQGVSSFTTCESNKVQQLSNRSGVKSKVLFDWNTGISSHNQNLIAANFHPQLSHRTETFLPLTVGLFLKHVHSQVLCPSSDIYIFSRAHQCSLFSPLTLLHKLSLGRLPLACSNGMWFSDGFLLADVWLAIEEHWHPPVHPGATMQPLL